MHKNHIIAAAFAASLPLQASAQSTPTYDWTGFYGGAFTTINTNAHSTHNNLSSGNTTGEFDLDGRMTGIALGYNRQNGQLVYGLELDAGFGSIEGDTEVICSLGGCSTDITSMFTARGRVGYAFGSFLPYLTAGIAAADIEVNVNNGMGQGDERQLGYVVGLGAEYAVTDRFTLKADWLYSDFEDFEIDIDIGGGFSVIDRIETDANMLRIGVNFQF